MKGFIALVLALCASTASANLVTVRADYFRPGTNVSSIVNGVTLTHVWEHSNEPGFTPNYSDVFAQSEGFGRETGDGLRPWGMMFEAYLCMSTGEVACRDGYDFLQLDFDTPVHSFEMVNYWWSDSPSIYAFNAAGDMISFVSSYTLLENLIYERLSVSSVTRTEHDIARVWVGGRSGIIGVREISFSVPEPATAGLLGLGLIGAVVARRRKRFAPDHPASCVTE